MRKILFRGKTLTGKWVEGAYYKQELFYGDKEDAHIIITSKETLDNDFALERYIVIPETIGQYTGLRDKNGKKIFEGDIVKLYLIDGIEEGVIKFNDIMCRFMFFTKDGGYGFDNECFFEIIGNIHDNPELLIGGESNA